MTHPPPTEVAGPEHYLNAIKAFHAYAGMTLFAFARQECSLRDTMIRNLIARSSTMLNGIGQLWQIDDYQDCWILHRCLMDRLFPFGALGRNERIRFLRSLELLSGG